MKRSWIGLALLLLLLILSLAAGWYMDRCQRPIARELDNAAELALAGDWEGGAAALNAAWEGWDGCRQVAACFADHNPMEEIDALFSRLEVWAQLRLSGEFAAGCRELSRKVEAMGQAHGLMWWNFL